MQIPLQIRMQGLPRSPALDARIRECAARLDEFNSHVTSCRVAVEAVGRRHRHGREFRVSVEVHSPGGKVAVSSMQRNQDAQVAVRDAFEAVRRQVAAYVEQRRDVKAQTAPA